MSIIRQARRYVIVGLGSNLALYAIYLLITSLGMGHMAAVLVLYPLGVLLTFAFNRNWSFEHSGPGAVALRRYFLVYLAGFIVNLALIYLFVDVWNYPHQLVQGVLILFVAALIFTGQKLWVFRPPGPAN